MSRFLHFCATAQEHKPSRQVEPGSQESGFLRFRRKIPADLAPPDETPASGGARTMRSHLRVPLSFLSTNDGCRQSLWQFYFLAPRAPRTSACAVMRRIVTSTSSRKTTLTIVPRLLSLWLLALVFSLCTAGAIAFVPESASSSQTTLTSSDRTRNVASSDVSPVSRTSLRANNFWDDVTNFFDNLGNDSSGSGNSGGGEDNLSSTEEQQYLGSTRIFTIPVEAFKVGGLRLYISLYVMGQCNTPEKGSWKSWQSGDAGIDCYFHDQSGALMIELCEETNRIIVDRMGTSPSNAYIMNESVIIDGLLDELDTIARDEEIAMEDRLLVLKEPGDAIDAAREGLAFL